MFCKGSRYATQGEGHSAGYMQSSVGWVYLTAIPDTHQLPILRV
jgi:hypothetical protein